MHAILKGTGPRGVVTIFFHQNYDQRYPKKICSHRKMSNIQKMLYNKQTKDFRHQVPEQKMIVYPYPIITASLNEIDIFAQISVLRPPKIEIWVKISISFKLAGMMGYG